MDESDEDIGPLADLMAEHNLSSTDIKKPIESILISDQELNLLDYLSYFNLRSFFKDIFTSLLDIQWYHYINQTFPQTTRVDLPNPSLKNLSFLCIVS